MLWRGDEKGGGGLVVMPFYCAVSTVRMVSEKHGAKKKDVWLLEVFALPVVVIQIPMLRRRLVSENSKNAGCVKYFSGLLCQVELTLGPVLLFGPAETKQLKPQPRNRREYIFP